MKIIQKLLFDFIHKANAQKGASDLVRNWDRQLRIVPTDETDSEQLIKVYDQKFYTEQECPHDLPELLLRGPHQLLCEIFSGEKSPVECFFAGDIELFSTDEDQVKLDCLCVLLWGI